MLRKAIGAAFFVSAAFYLLFGAAPSLWLAMLAVVGAHAGGSIQWVFSTTLLQLSVPNRFLGRVFALELALVTLTMSLSTYLSGWALEHGGMTPRAVALMLGFTFVVPGICWLVVQQWLNRETPAAPPKVVIESEPISETSFPPT
jgi:hypothetical protein